MLGRHDGIIHFTVGQRRGLGIAAGQPLYVVRLDAAARRVVVGPREALRTSRMRLRDVNWLGDGTIEQALCAGWHEVFVKVRSTRPPQPAWLSRGAGGIEVDLVAGEDGVSPGQACVFYDAPTARRACSAAASSQSAVGVTMRGAPPRARAVGVPFADDRARVGVTGERDGGELDINTIAKAYARWAPVYDLVFGAVFDAGRKASIAAAERIGGRILDVGVGTGISLPDYSPDQLASSASTIPSRCCARRSERVAEHKLANVEALAVMDAQQLGFPDALLRRRWWRNTSSPRCPTRKRRSTSSRA